MRRLIVATGKIVDILSRIVEVRRLVVEMRRRRIVATWKILDILQRIVATQTVV